MLSVSNLSVSFDDNHVLDGFNLDLQSGDIFALLGDSGSGKSSALRFIAGLESASNGRVALDGNNLSLDGNHSVKPELREIGMVFQDYALFPHMTVFQNISFGIDYLSKKDKIERVQTLLELISLQGIEKKYPHQLSGGEQQRVAIARALLRDTPILLLDEATSALDAESEKFVQEAIEKLSKGRTTLVIAHRLSTIHDADQIIVLSKGSIAEIGTHDNLINQKGTYSNLYSLQSKPSKEVDVLLNDSTLISNSTKSPLNLKNQKSLVKNKHNFLSPNSKNLNWVQRLLIAIARKLTF